MKINIESGCDKLLSKCCVVCVLVAGDPGPEQVSETVQIQQGSGNQVVYQPQYVDGSPSPSDHATAIYAASNGHMYE